MVRFFISPLLLIMISLGWSPQASGSQAPQPVAPPLVVNSAAPSQTLSSPDDSAPVCQKKSGKSPVLVLSIDGAAVRGIAQFELLRAIEEKVNAEMMKKEQSDYKSQGKSGGKINIRRESITDIFDFFAGTSAGSVNVGAILIPRDSALANTSGHQVKPKFSLDELKEKLPDNLKAAFSGSLFRKIRTAGGLMGSKFTAKPLEEFLQEYMGTARMSDLVKPAVITSYDFREREIMNFSTYESCGIKEPGVCNTPEGSEEVVYYQPPDERGYTWKDKNVFLWQAVRASSAAPVFYKPLELKLEGKARALIDAGLFVMSPTLLAWIEAQKIYPGRPLVIISISSGALTQSRTVKASGATAGGIIQVLQPTIETAFEGQQALTDKMMRDLPGIEYHRLSFEVINKEFDDASEKNVQALLDAAKKTIASADFNDAISSIVKARLERKEKNDLGPFICKAKEKQKASPPSAQEEEVRKKIARANEDHQKPKPVSPEQQAQIRKFKDQCQALKDRKKMKEWTAMKCQNAEEGK